MELGTTANYFDIMGQARKSYGKTLEPLCQRRQLTRSELDVMLFLYNNPGFDRAADIVSHRGIAKSHVSLSVATLTGRGLLERQTTPEDRRTIHLKLTEEGRRIAREARTLQEAFFARLFAGITREELTLWLQIIEKVQKNVKKM